MKKTKLLKAVGTATLGGALMAAASMAFAADTADLTVTGTIVPSACSASFAGGDTVDFGTIKVQDLSSTAYNNIGTRTTTLNVTCQTSKAVQFKTTDAQSASSMGTALLPTLSASTSLSSAYVYGLGTATVNGSAVNLGGYTLKLGTPTVDGKSVTPIYSTDSGSVWAADAAMIDHGGTNTYAGGTGASYILGIRVNSGSITSGKVTSFPLTVTAALNKGSALALTEDAKLNGQAVFTVMYN